jgi:hypothetical protein
MRCAYPLHSSRPSTPALEPAVTGRTPAGLQQQISCPVVVPCLMPQHVAAGRAGPALAVPLRGNASLPVCTALGRLCLLIL